MAIELAGTLRKGSDGASHGEGLGLGDEQERPVAQVGFNARRAAAGCLTPFRPVRLEALPTFPLPPVEEDPYLAVLCEMMRQVVPQIGLVSRHDDQTPNPVA